MASSAKGRPSPGETNRRAGGRARANSRGDSTRLRILTTAEQLFAERGIAAAPLRDIGVAAGQKNNAAVQYHFGDRESLIRAIIAHRAVPSEKRRVEMLADLLGGGRQPTVDDLVRMFVIPLAGHLERDNHYLAFLSRYIIERGGYAGLDGTYGPTVETLRSLLPRLLPNYPDEVREERWLMMQTSAVHTLARYQTVMTARALTTPIDALLEDLVQFMTAGIEAPLARSADDNTGRTGSAVIASL